MIFHPADIFSELLFSFFSVAMLMMPIFAIFKFNIQRKYLIALISYLILFGAVVKSEWLETHVIPGTPLLFFSVIAMAFYFAFSEFGTTLAHSCSFSILVGLQSFRFFLELLLHHWSEIGTIPQTMTWTGQNWDILTGIFALGSIPWLNRNLKLVWCVQILGSLLLFNVIRVALLSMPLPFSWQLENPLQLIFHLPYAFIGPLFVGFALNLHLVGFIKLWMLKNGKARKQ